ncbi:MAG: TonB-dependent siderophore receptor [Cypionkella sp.]|uniref:TonB-dependent siderophore receptor n=1 Tax=Cypionkella sp. TaxID=2811411 RepID=UPI002ABA5EE0|nr:TonB-dependent siderophore receptor [Cypionkella sp.]MDZ4309061.1 TonB-dependent siderophore receptor [Cypionkella sp.]
MTSLPSRSRLALLLGQTALIACTLPQLAVAQTTTVLEPIVVTGEGEGSATGPVTSNNPATLTGSKTATPVTEVPQSVSVVSSETLKASNVAKLDGALSYVAGVTGQPYGYDSDTNWIFIRGFNASQHGAYQDGLANNAYGFGSFFIDPFLVERIEVLKGASSVLYGGSNPGGLVNYVTKAPTGEDKTVLEFGLDEHGRAWASVDQNRVVSDALSYRLLGKIERVDGHGAFDPGVHALLSGSVEQKLDNGAVLSYGLDLLKVDEAHVGNAWLPYVGTVQEASFGFIARDFNVGEPDHDSYKRDQASLRFGFTQDIGDWTLTNTSRLSWADISERSVVAYGYSTFGAPDAVGTLVRGVFDHDTSQTSFVTDTRLENTFVTGALEHRVMTGLDLKNFKTDILEKSAYPATPLTVVDPIYGAIQPAAAAYKDVDITQRQAGVYLQDQIRWGNGWIATGNLRYDWVETEASADPAAGTTGSKRNDSELTWRLGLAKTVVDGMTVYGSLSTSFNPTIEPSSEGNDIYPETARQAELGVKWALSDNFLLTASAFDITRKNVSQSRFGLIVDPDTGAERYGYIFSQIGEVESKGFELEAQGRIAEGLTISAALTKMDLDVINDQNAALIGNTPREVPEEFASLQLGWTPATMPELTLTGAARYTGGSWADDENTAWVPSRTVFDLGVSYEMQDDWKANLAISNVTDKSYVSSCAGTNYCYYGEGRTASISISKSF